MTTTFNIKNTRTENAQILVFYEFSNGEVNTAYFEPTAQISDILAWGTDRASWFDLRQIELEQLALQAQELVEVENDDSNL